MRAAPGAEVLACHHCGEPCRPEPLTWKDRVFCCGGCLQVCELLESFGLGDYYLLNLNPGTRPDDAALPDFDIRNNLDLAKEVIRYEDETHCHVRVHIPAIHCSSCVWLLEKLPRLCPGVERCEVDLTYREALVVFLKAHLDLKQVFQTLASLGYAPELRHRFGDAAAKTAEADDALVRLGIVGFCFGNLMLLSFPEYLLEAGETIEYVMAFHFLKLVLILPVVFFGARDYFVQSWRVLKHRQLNLDVPIALGILAFLGLSFYDFGVRQGGGYFDSLAGLIFFLSLGKWFGKKSFAWLSFDRDYRSYFPVSVSRRAPNGQITPVALSRIAAGDQLFIRNQEIIPADCRLRDGRALIDYSFVTGESVSVAAMAGDVLFAGGRQKGSSLVVEVIRSVDQSHLTRLWNNPVFVKAPSRYLNLMDVRASYFTPTILILALLALFYWLPLSVDRAVWSFASVLIVACPCALALAAPFTMGMALRILSRWGIFVRSGDVLEKMTGVTDVIFDKTGTLTNISGGEVQFFAKGTNLTARENQMIFSVVMNSLHPLSQQISQYCGSAGFPLEVENFVEEPGAGVSGRVGEFLVKVGSKAWVGWDEDFPAVAEVDGVAYVWMDGVVRGAFVMQAKLRPGLDALLKNLSQKVKLHLITGDRERASFGKEVDQNLFFTKKYSQSPEEKLLAIQNLRHAGATVMMIGDGLNDAGALRASDVGVAVTDGMHAFAPACDVIMMTDRLKNLTKIMDFSGATLRVLRANIAVSLLYNVMGLGFALSGVLAPVVCAILMPVSSLSVMLLATQLCRRAAWRAGFVEAALAKLPEQKLGWAS